MPSRKTTHRRRQIFHLLAFLIAAPLESLFAQTLPEKLVIDTHGGLGGEIITVDNLNDHGPGSLRAAIAEQNPRLIVFNVGGIIHLEHDLSIIHPFTTIAGQTAPSPGITLTGATLKIRTHNIVIEHIRIRVGDKPGPKPETRDAISIYGTKDYKTFAHDVIVRNCSLSWAIDEIANVGWASNRILFDGNIFSEALNNSTHPDGPHSMGFLAGSGAQKIIVRNNLFIHNRGRNPQFAPGTSGIIAENVIYNAGWGWITLKGKPSNQPSRIDIYGNIGIRGQSDENQKPLISAKQSLANETKLFEIDNYINTDSSLKSFASAYTKIPDQLLGKQSSYTIESPPLMPIQQIDWIQNFSGARPTDRDAIDKRLINELRTRTGGVIDKPKANDLKLLEDTPIVYRELVLPDTDGLDDKAKISSHQQWLENYTTNIMPQ